MDMQVETTHITPTEETYGGLQKAYDWFNERLFFNRLPGALIVMTRRKKTEGYYAPSQYANKLGVMADEISLNPQYFLIRPVEHVLSVLVHEMTHQNQYHFGSPARSGYHNREFAEMMQKVGLVASTTGFPGGNSVGEHMAHYIAEGGAFIVECRALLETDWGLDWFDRYPETLVLESPNQSHLDALEIESEKPEVQVNEQALRLLKPELILDGELSGIPPEVLDMERKAESQEEQKEKKKSGRKPNLAVLAPAALSKPVITSNDALANNLGVSLDSESELAPNRRGQHLIVSNPDLRRLPASKTGRRSKYTCPVCKISVWGKAEIRVLCGSDGCESAHMEVAAA